MYVKGPSFAYESFLYPFPKQETNVIFREFLGSRNSRESAKGFARTVERHKNKKKRKDSGDRGRDV